MCGCFVRFRILAAYVGNIFFFFQKNALRELLVEVGHLWWQTGTKNGCFSRSRSLTASPVRPNEGCPRVREAVLARTKEMIALFVSTTDQFIISLDVLAVDAVFHVGDKQSLGTQLT